MKSFFFTFICGVTALLFSISLNAQQKTNPTNQSEELGNVSWYRNYEEALTLAKKEKKAVLILFQEVPGCSTCRNYGHNVLTHPLMVEAIEELFIPLAIYNNKGGADKVVLEKYGEPSWNNPVVRIVDPKGKDLVKRIGGDYSANTLINRMQKVINLSGQKQPEYVKLFAAEIAAKKRSTAVTTYFKMYCFWSGENHFADLEGILKTEPGFIGHNEVVQVTFDKSLISSKEVTAHAKKASCTPISSNGNYKIANNDLKYYLQKTDYRYLPLTEQQQIKINHALYNGQTGLTYLSPQQRKWLLEIKAGKIEKKDRFNLPFTTEWNKMK